MAKKLIIAAPSARSYAQAARACGYDVIALDAFIDADTQVVCAQTFKLKLNDNVLDEADFKRVFGEIALSIDLDEVDGFLYGSLFDNCPDVLAWVAARVRLLGNTPDVLKQAKDFSFFKLLDDLEIPHPEVRVIEQNSQPSFPQKRESILTLKTSSKKMDSLLRTTRVLRFAKCSSTCKVVCGNDEVENEWLSKRIGGTGGTHIRLAANHHSSASAGDYFQRNYFQKKQDGKPISMLFVADGITARLIGFNEQFIAPTIDMPYRFAGAVGGVVLPENVQRQFDHTAQKLTTALGLCGINSLDAIFDGETLLILELNPRLSATFDLYQNLLPAHIQACAGKLVDIEPQPSASNAQLIVYADVLMQIASDKKWPTWVADISPPNSIIAAGMPICTVLATAQNAAAATQMVLERARSL